ncbi:Uncharacterized protein Fot_02266 [Forsythia ovata]|uniref:Uncharacterized protein n=1 Tax=Forsythia ovata TaxID=205694 RepID=A0ABD1X6C2_9LAMI
MEGWAKSDSEFQVQPRAPSEAAKLGRGRNVRLRIEDGERSLRRIGVIRGLGENWWRLGGECGWLTKSLDMISEMGLQLEVRVAETTSSKNGDAQSPTPFIKKWRFNFIKSTY